MVDTWIQEIKEKANPELLGMILVHNGVVRATSKDGKAVRMMKLSFDRDKLQFHIKQFKAKEGILDIRVWINEGILKVGDDIMYTLVAGRFRADVLPTLQELLSVIKNDIVREEEVF